MDACREISNGQRFFNNPWLIALWCVTVLKEKSDTVAMKKIQILSEDIANRIAAGEVVERPASVVKELVENSIDAGARRILVRIEGAGKDLILVEDDGEGMAPDDAVTAFKRHATSKIRSTDDLNRLSTMGFRGEALPSVASVSRLRLTTRNNSEQEGIQIFFDGGSVASRESVGAPVGTIIAVKDLFFNVPARRKFLKSDASEQKNIVEAATQLALVHFDVGFELKTDARRLISLPPDQSREERTADLLGSGTELYWANFESEEYQCVLAYSAPHEARRNRTNMRFFVNDRPIVDKLLFRALMDGYGGCLVSGHFPLALLWLKIPADQLDVNVHPAKREVRFQDERRVFRWVAGCASEAVSRAPWAAGIRGESMDIPLESGAGLAPRVPLRQSGRCGLSSQGHVERVKESLERYVPRTSVPSFCQASTKFSPQPLPPASIGPEASPLAWKQSASQVDSRFGRLYLLGSFDSTYVIFEDRDNRELVLFDQHAAHERILYELFMDASAAANRRSQSFLFPAAMECTAVEMAAYEEKKEDFQLMGFAVERFGSSSLAVSAAPEGLGPGAAEAVVRDFLGAEDLCAPGADRNERLEAVAKRIACSAAVKARSSLLPSEAVELVRRLDNLKNPSHCPHGRPLVVRISRVKLESLFHRK